MGQLKLVEIGAIKVPEDVVFERVGDETVLLDLERGIYYGLDSVGRRVWDLITEFGDPRVMLERILDEYDVSSDVLTRDIERLLGELAEKKLIVITPATLGDGR